MRSTRFALPALLLVLIPLTVAAGPPGFGKLPTLNGKKSPIKLRVVEYTGSTNGGMVIEVRNDGAKKAAFSAKGLFFVPNVNPDDAPQRLGAAGPFERATEAGWKVTKRLELAPGQTERLKVQVFCIDSHRASPSSSTPFRLASKRLPKELSQKIEAGTQRLMKARKARSAKGISGDVQGHVWKTRNKKWIRLEGERKNEKASPQKHHPLQRQRRIKRPLRNKTPQQLR